MVEVIWTVPALSDLDAIADYIALDNPRAAALLVQRIFAHVGQLAEHPRSGSKAPELEGSRYRQLVEQPCRVLYRAEKARVFILNVVRSERLLQAGLLAVRAKGVKKSGKATIPRRAVREARLEGARRAGGGVGAEVVSARG